MCARFFDHPSQELGADGTSLGRAVHGDGADLGEAEAVEMQCCTGDDFATLFDDDEVANVFADLLQSSRQKRAVVCVLADQVEDGRCVRKYRFTRAHSSPHVMRSASALR